ncbi:MAG: hypothetical protein U0795_02755 [Pirellulales bacterium]
MSGKWNWRRMSVVGCVCGLIVSAAVPTLGGAEIGFVEQFVLSADREKTLLQLVPGTEDYYYYHTLYYQTSGNLDKVQPLLDEWAQRLGQTQRWLTMNRRQQLLTYDRHPEQTREYVRQQLGVEFNHQRQSFDSSPDLPTTLPPATISRETLEARARAQANLQGFEDPALLWLIDQPLTVEQRRELLQRWTWPSHAKLVGIVLEDLRDPNSPRFGGYPIHLQLLKDQLDQLAGAMPELLSNDVFVGAYLRRLMPSPAEDIVADLDARQRYLDRLTEFADRLPPSFNSLRACILNHQLKLDMRRGKPNRETFFRYIRLPRNAPYVNPKFLELPENQRAMVDLGANYGDNIVVPPIGSDDDLVREYLLYLLPSENSLREFQPYFREEYLKQLYAEAKLVAGVGAANQWAGMLTPEQFQALRDRIDIDFAADNQEYFRASDKVALDLWVKNVDSLLVKVYRINALKFFQDKQTQINTDINLDGLTPGHELRLEYKDPAIRRVRRTIELPQITEPGTYVIDLIGNGKSSRALIRKGRLSFTETVTAAGHRLRVYDETGALHAKASVWISGHLFAADDRGDIVVPFTREPGPQSMVLISGRQATLASLQHLGENYRLETGFLVDREQLLQHRKATIVLRAGLYLNGQVVPIELLKEPVVEVTTTDLDGISSTKFFRDLKFENLRDTELQFQVPPRVVTLRVKVSGKVENLAQRDRQDVVSERTYQFNAIDQTDQIEAVHLVRSGREHQLHVLGKTGERQPGRVVDVRIKHRDFRDEVIVQLKTDEQGIVRLGTLADINSITASAPAGGARTWVLIGDQALQYAVLHVAAGEPFTVAYSGRATSLSPDEFALVETRADVPVADHFKTLKLTNHLLVCSGLPAGEYRLNIRSTGEQFVVRTAAGKADGGWLVGPTRHLEVRPDVPLQIGQVQRDGEVLVIQLSGANEGTRVVVAADRFEPSFPIFPQMAAMRTNELTARIFPQLPSALTTGRNIGDEYRYILQRQFAKRYPGNMLARPELLLNPWELQATATAVQELEAAEAPAAAAPAPAASLAEQQADQAKIAAQGDLPNLDFLPDTSRILLNLIPDEKGQVRVPIEQLGNRHDIHILAYSPTRVTYRRVTGEAPAIDSLDLRLAKSIDVQRHVILIDQARVLKQGESLVLPAGRDAKWEIYDDLTKVYQVLVSGSGNPELGKFEFLLRWHSLSQEEKQKFYTQFACHELHFFIYQKDRPFFDAVVKPFLQNKREKTFVDRWLLEESLDADAALPLFSRLNVWEQVMLARRQPGQLDRTRRRLDDLFAMRPPQPEQDSALFELAVRGLMVESGVRQELTAESAPMLAKSMAMEGRAMAGEASMGGGGYGGGLGGAAGFGMPAAGEVANNQNGSVAADRLERFGGMAQRVADEPAAPGGVNGPSDARKDVDFSASFARDLDAKRRLREDLKAFYVPLEATKEWAESNYYRVLRTQQPAELVPLSGYWRDFAHHDPASPFISTKFLHAKSTINEMLLVLATMDLPVKAGEHDIKMEGDAVKLTAGSPLVVFYEDLRDAQPEASTSGVLVSQNFFLQGDRTTFVDGQQAEKFVTGEFLTDRVYGCKVVATNTTSVPKTVHLLLQIPAGAIPVQGAKQTRSAPMRLEAYQTQSVEYLFYFPLPGKFQQYPVHARSDERLIAFAEPQALNVVDRPTQVDKTSWTFVSQEGSNDEVLEFLRKANLYQLNLDMVAFRLNDREFFTKLTELLSQREYFHPVIWSYAIKHGDVPRIRELLAQNPSFISLCGLQLHSPLLDVDAEQLGLYEHLEYKPLVNARAHQVGNRREILNDRFHAQYHRWLDVLSFQSGMSDRDELATVYYLLLQDRIEESLKMYAGIDAGQLKTRIQYDYVTAYLDFFEDQPQKAGAIADRYRDYPVDHWRKAFAEIRQQLAEIQGTESDKSRPDSNDPFPRQEDLANREPVVGLQLDGRNLKLTTQNLDAVRLNFYLVDVELLFSTQPFAHQQQGQFALVEPNATKEVQIPAGETQTVVPMPDDLASKHVYVEVVGAGKSAGQLYFANSLQLVISDRFGQLSVRDAQTGRPLPKTYVKVYSQMQDGSVQFYKDGYTDLRGKFDYVSLSTNQLDNSTKLSVLILSESHGAVVRELDPPKR